MPTLKEVEFYLRGLWLLFKQDPAGFSYLDLTDRGALRSFWSILWALPAILVSFAWWRLLYLQGLPDGTATGALFFFRLALVEASNWVFPLVLLGILCWLIGVGEKFAAMVVVTNWLALPVSYSYGLLVLLMMFVPALAGIVAFLWLLLMITLIAALFRIVRMIVGDQLLMVSTIVMVLLVPSMIIAEVLEQYLGVYPG
ncbi:sensor histidine kinase YesM [Rhizobium rosettiformans]|uniref:Yip1 domain-containing protein n=2 Tax=Rhizobium rosettiformans TaxID=1368430 RepID=A0A4S8Q2Z2_9HYPH|nr:hypothetical protein [Rhizobium rosettiformans]MBB5276241.1 sensor histidine kinase YesM [Rhizobium rosettiformans]THV36875.1 hypothetical protein FAA86_10280 [Rhizobium rosettiformans W3]